MIGDDVTLVPGVWRDRSGREYEIVLSPIPFVDGGVTFPWKEEASSRTWTNEGRYRPDGTDSPFDLVNLVRVDEEPQVVDRTSCFNQFNPSNLDDVYEDVEESHRIKAVTAYEVDGKQYSTFAEAVAHRGNRVGTLLEAKIRETKVWPQLSPLTLLAIHRVLIENRKEFVQWLDF
jgi:hypothetical protein